jgi:hypothetical protein
VKSKTHYMFHLISDISVLYVVIRILVLEQCLNDTKEISYCYQQFIDISIQEEDGELLRDTSIQSYMDAYIRQVALNPKLSLESCQCKQVGIQTVLKVVNNTPGPMNSYIEQRVMHPSTRSDANRIQKQR